ncbi:hypothetical protein Hypma_012333 [Hypsizygus marmoreus]|uniref:Uncharacterized protein n=1 Tax=Hypsizygus marmoreus TaxID=39966 RepID=A0A369K6E7_HYPMA|nr:hypothetical protein Hypma_012333 [Hypsizygus marmoreus]
MIRHHNDNHNYADVASSLLVSAMLLQEYFSFSHSGSAGQKRARVEEELGCVGPDIQRLKKCKLVHFLEEHGIRGPSILNTPNEVILAILEDVPDNSLIVMAGACRRIQPLSILVYLCGLQILSSELGSQEIELCQNVPAVVFRLLSSVHLMDQVHFNCDMFYLLEHEAALEEFIVRTPIVSVSLQIYSHEPAIICAPRATCQEQHV